MATAKEKLTALADAVREKTGDSGKLSLDRMTALINTLSVGGGGGNAPALPDGWDTGEFVFAEDTIGNESEEGLAFSHKLGKIPNFIFIWLEEPVQNATFVWRTMTKINIGIVVDEDTGESYPEISGANGLRMARVNHSSQQCVYDHDDTAKEFYLPYYSSTKYKAGYKYKWLAVSFEE